MPRTNLDKKIQNFRKLTGFDKFVILEKLRNNVFIKSDKPSRRKIKYLPINKYSIALTLRPYFQQCIWSRIKTLYVGPLDSDMDLDDYHLIGIQNFKELTSLVSSKSKKCKVPSDQLLKNLKNLKNLYNNTYVFSNLNLIKIFNLYKQIPLNFKFFYKELYFLKKFMYLVNKRLKIYKKIYLKSQKQQLLKLFMIISKRKDPNFNRFLIKNKKNKVFNKEGQYDYLNLF